jgi:spore germination protein
MNRLRGVVWPYLLLGVALVAALAFGWYQTRQVNRLALDAENKYMSAFHKMKWTSENMEERTAKLMATNDRQLQQGLLADLRVFSAQAVEHMAVLPFLTTNTPRIENFLNTMREKSDLYHEKLTQGIPLSEADWAQIAELRRQSVFFEKELSNVLGLVGGGMIRWRDTVRVTGPAQTGDATTPITQSILQLDRALQPPPGEEQQLAGGMTPLARPRTPLGPRVDGATAVSVVKRFVDRPLKGEPVLTGQSEPNDRLQPLSLYYINAQKANGTPLNFGVSVHGGHVIYMLDGRTVNGKRLNQQQLVDQAQQLLQRWGYRNLNFVSGVENDGIMTMEFAPLQQGVAIESDKVKLMLAMDDGELLGFDARNYWVNRYDRNLPKPALDAAGALKRVSPRVKVTGKPRLALIADRRNRERLCWEVRGTIADQRYRIFVDAASGQEVDVQRVSGDPAPTFNEG